MPVKIIISYDDTDNDRDAIALGRLLAHPGADLALAYVRHTEEPERDREREEERHAQQLLDHGARLIGKPDMPRHVVFHASTGEGLLELAEREHADAVVFGSDYRTAPGAVVPQASAQRLLHGGPVAVAIAPADLRSSSKAGIGRIRVLAEAGDDAPGITAHALADTLGASITERNGGPVDLLVVGSRQGAPPGRVELSAASEYVVETAHSPVLVVPAGTPVRFDARAPS
jgi:nucleotide-binding universal stress UspA family protein